MGVIATPNILAFAAHSAKNITLEYGIFKGDKFILLKYSVTLPFSPKLLSVIGNDF
jgi:hypothetical protein